MRVKNTSNFPDTFVRRMLRWCMKEVGLKKLHRATFRNRKTARYSGHAWSSGRIVVSINSDPASYPIRHGNQRSRRDAVTGECPMLADPIETLVIVTAHEVAHIDDYSRNKWGRGAEDRADAPARYVLRRFRENREALLAEWNKPTIEKPKINPIEARAVKAAVALAKWERKAKLARTKIAVYRRRVNYYERRAATSSRERQSL